MKVPKLIRFGAIAALALALQAGEAQAQTVQASDIQRLQAAVYEASRDVAQLRARDALLASQIQAELDDLGDETTYFKVKLRKNEPIGQSELADLGDKIEDLRSRARGATSGRYSSPTGTVGSRPSRETAPRNVVPVGTELDVRLQSRLSSVTAQVEDRVEATTLVDVLEDDRVVVPAGSVMRGIVQSVQKAGRLERKGSLTVAFDRITVRGRSHPIRATVTQALESEGIRGEAGRIGAGAGVGAIIGGILGGMRGALAGILIGGGGTIAATEGTDVDLAAGTALRVRLDTPLDLR